MHSLRREILRRAAATSVAPAAVGRRRTAAAQSRPATCLPVPARERLCNGGGATTLCSPRLATHRSFASSQQHDDNVGVGITVAVSRKAKKGGSSEGYCYGCGADLVKGPAAAVGTMGTVERKTGYWHDQKHDLKKSKLKNWALCHRCKTLKRLELEGGSSSSSGGGGGVAGDEEGGALGALGPDSQMTQIFRDEVSKIRAKENVVVVLCVDAMNVTGTFLRTIRNYVGGNPILLAVTRCDLLPAYVWKEKSVNELHSWFVERVQDIHPADVYFCSEEQDHTGGTKGVPSLGEDLWTHLDGRDPYVIGAANIGKSTLTDLLIHDFMERGEALDTHYVDPLRRKRFDKLTKSRPTMSSMPGTTLQNIRVPCFPEHGQALWDTPGLLLDEALLKHFPLRNLRQLRAQRPDQIKPRLFETEKKSCALLVCEKGHDDNEDFEHLQLPLLRVEIRLKKSAHGEGPLRLVWNSTLTNNCDIQIVDTDEALRDEKTRLSRLSGSSSLDTDDDEHGVESNNNDEEEEGANSSMPSKAERRQAYLEKIQQEQNTLGKAEWERRQQEAQHQHQEKQRALKLAQLFKVHEVIVERGVPTDVAVSNFGWVTIVTPRTALIRTYAPSTGVEVSDYPALAVPGEWADYIIQPQEEDEDDGHSKEDDRAEKVVSDDDDNDDELFSDDDEKYDEQWSSPYEHLDDDSAYDFFGGDDDGFDWNNDDDHGHREGSFAGEQHDDAGAGFQYQYDDKRASSHQSTNADSSKHHNSDDHDHDPWRQYSGEHVGWQFDHDTRFSKTVDFEGWNPIRDGDSPPVRPRNTSSKARHQQPIQKRPMMRQERDDSPATRATIKARQRQQPMQKRPPVMRQAQRKQHPRSSTSAQERKEKQMRHGEPSQVQKRPVIQQNKKKHSKQQRKREKEDDNSW